LHGAVQAEVGQLWTRTMYYPLPPRGSRKGAKKAHRFVFMPATGKQ